VNPIDKLVDQALENESSYITDPPRARRLVMRDAALAILALLALVGEDALPDPWRNVAGVLVGAFVAFGLFNATRRAVSYKSGWLHGRSAMISSMSEAMGRDMSIEEWLHAELSRDAVVMGVPAPFWEEGPGEGLRD
jgi:hypothetical protein